MAVCTVTQCVSQAGERGVRHRVRVRHNDHALGGKVPGSARVLCHLHGIAEGACLVFVERLALRGNALLNRPVEVESVSGNSRLRDEEAVAVDVDRSRR